MWQDYMNVLRVEWAFTYKHWVFELTTVVVGLAILLYLRKEEWQ